MALFTIIGVLFLFICFLGNFGFCSIYRGNCSFIFYTVNAEYIIYQKFVFFFFFCIELGGGKKGEGRNLLSSAVMYNYSRTFKDLHILKITIKYTEPRENLKAKFTTWFRTELKACKIFLRFIYFSSLLPLLLICNTRRSFKSLYANFPLKKKKKNFFLPLANWTFWILFLVLLGGPFVFVPGCYLKSRLASPRFFLNNFFFYIYIYLLPFLFGFCFFLFEKTKKKCEN